MVQVHLDSLPREAGEGNLAPLPRALQGQPGYDRALVVRCPSNQGADKRREVSFTLRRDYLDLTATVRPYFAAPDDRDSAVHVFALVGIRERDDTVSRTERGSQYDARTGVPQPLTAAVDGADTLTIQVGCQLPGGVVILTDAVVTHR